jgi:hypothetical protein
MFNEAIRNELTKAKRLANLIEEVGDHLAILFEQDNLEMEHFELSEGQTGWVYAIKLKDNDVDFSGVVDYGTCVERLVLNIYEDVWNNEILPESEMEEANYTKEQLLEKIEDLNAYIVDLEMANEALLSILSNTENIMNKKGE